MTYLKKIFTALLLLICSLTDAATYYIDPTGNDTTGDGSIGNPWLTLGKATTIATTIGDIIHVNAGTYTQLAFCTLSVGVSIEGAGYATTTINATGVTDYTPLIDMFSANGTNGNQHITGITFDGGYVSAGNNKTWLCIWITGRNNVDIYDCRIRNFLWRGVIYNGNTVDNPGTDIGQNHATGNEFYNNIMTNCADYGISGGGSGALNLGFQEGMLIHHNTIQQNERPEGLNGWPIKFWNDGWNEGVKVYNNTLIKIPYGGTYPGESGWDFAFEMFNVQGMEIYNNEIINGSLDFAYSYKNSANNTYDYCVWIHDNILYNTVQNTQVEGTIIFEYATENAIVEDNIIYNKTYGITYNTRGVNENGDDNLPLVPPPQYGYSYINNNIIRNNLFYNMYVGSGIGNRFIIGVIAEGIINLDPQVRNVEIYNNTMVSDATDPLGIAFDFTSQTHGSVNQIYIKNNIVQGFTDSWIRGDADSTKMDSVQLTHNDIYNCGNSNNALWPAGNPTVYTVSNNINALPLFIGGSDYRVQSGSPCINAGVDVGLPFYGSAPTIGYWQYGAPSTNGFRVNKKVILQE